MPWDLLVAASEDRALVLPLDHRVIVVVAEVGGNFSDSPVLAPVIAGATEASRG